MTYTNGFTINALGNECFITFLQNKPDKEKRVSTELETIVMNEQCARQLIAALAQVYAKVDQDRLQKKEKVDVSETHQLS